MLSLSRHAASDKEVFACEFYVVAVVGITISKRGAQYDGRADTRSAGRGIGEAQASGGGEQPVVAGRVEGDFTSSSREEPRREVDAVELARKVKEKIAARHGGPFETDSTDLIREYRDFR